LRPYGPHGERICPACGDLDPETTARQMDRHMAGTDVAILHAPRDGQR
jgi:hypothetical protein